ncbi:MAG: hypothetical protein WAX04_07610, partial [Oscillospiraceae bacterium]
WDEVPSSTYYRVFTSVVPLGAAAGLYELVLLSQTNSYTAEVETGKRHYFRLTADSPWQNSGTSIAVYIDIS